MSRVTSVLFVTFALMASSPAARAAELHPESSPQKVYFSKNYKSFNKSFMPDGKVFGKTAKSLAEPATNCTNWLSRAPKKLLDNPGSLQRSAFSLLRPSKSGGYYGHWQKDRGERTSFRYQPKTGRLTIKINGEIQNATIAKNIKTVLGLDFALIHAFGPKFPTYVDRHFFSRPSVNTTRSWESASRGRYPMMIRMYSYQDPMQIKISGPVKKLRRNADGSFSGRLRTGPGKTTGFRYNPRTGGVTFKFGGILQRVTVEKGITRTLRVEDAVTAALATYELRDRAGLSFTEAGRVAGEDVHIQPVKGYQQFKVK